MKTNRNIWTYLPVLISLLALVISGYSLFQSRENFQFNKTQIIVGKNTELLLLLREVEKLRRMEFDKLNQILEILEKNQIVLDKQKDQYSFFRKKMNTYFKDQEKDFNVFLDIIQHGEAKSIYDLESYIGMYKIALSYSVDSNEFLNETLVRLKKELQQSGTEKTEKVSE